MKRNVLMTAALPYANGPLHLGHMVEYVQADIYSRYLRANGDKVVFVCADDTHGTPIEINAAKQGITPNELIAKYYEEHLEDFGKFNVKFDSYYSTNSPENKKYADLFFTTLKEKGLIYQKEVENFYDEKEKRFLPDRYVKGKCPKCKSVDQYGDVCEVCNATYKPTDLEDPYSVLSGKKPVLRKSYHYFFKLSALSEKLDEWLTNNKNLSPEIVNYVKNWIANGLQDWDISRDGPYFGFKIPGEINKYYYVWLDAPIGYIASTENYAKENNRKTDEFWKENTEIIHFIGKDITYFHFLFWPAMLMSVGYNMPSDIVVHGFLNINGEKMSKSRGTFVTVKEYLETQEPELLRFFFSTYLTKSPSDINLNFDDFKNRINNDLVSNIANFVYRSASFLNNNFDSKLTKVEKNPVMDQQLEELYDKVLDNYKKLNYRGAIMGILEIGAFGNRYFQENEPWKLIKENKKQCHKVVTTSINIAKNIAVLISPIMPKYAASLQRQLNIPSLKFVELSNKLENTEISRARIVYAKIEDESFINEVKTFPLNLKVAEIIEIEDHPNADKLYKMKINLGSEERQLVAGLKSHYSKEDLQGRKIIVITNLKPANIRGVESQGMMLAAEKGKNLVPLNPGDAIPGTSIMAGDKKGDTKIIDIDDFKKFKLWVKDKKAIFDLDVLKTEKADVTVDIEDGAKIR